MHMNYSQIMSPRPPLPRKVGGHDPPAPMGAPPLHTYDMYCVACMTCGSWPGTYDMYCVACMSCVVIFGLCTV